MLNQVLQQLQSHLTTDEGRLLLKQTLELEQSPEPKQQAELYFFLFRATRKLCELSDPNPKAKKNDTPLSIEQLGKQLYKHLSRFKQNIRVSHIVAFFNAFDLLILGQNKGIHQIIVDWTAWLKWKQFWGTLLLELTKYIEGVHKNKKWLFELPPKNPSTIRLLDHKASIYSQFDDYCQALLKQYDKQSFFYSFNDWGIGHADMLIQKKNIFYLSVPRGKPFDVFRQWIGLVLGFYIDLIGDLYENESFFISSLEEMSLELGALIRFAQEAEQAPQFISFLDILQLSMSEEHKVLCIQQDKLISEKSRIFQIKEILSKLWHFINRHSYLHKQRLVIWVENAQWLDQESFESLVKFVEQQELIHPKHLAIFFNHAQNHDLLNLLSQLQAQRVDGMVELKTQIHLDELLGDSTYPLELVELVKPIKYKENQKSKGSTILWQEEVWDLLVLLTMEEKLKWLEAEQRWVLTEAIKELNADYVKNTWKDALSGLFEEDKIWLKKLYLCREMSAVLIAKVIPVSEIARLIDAGWINDKLKLNHQALLSSMEDIFDAEEQKLILNELISLIEGHLKESLILLSAYSVIENQDTPIGEEAQNSFDIDLGALENHLKDIQKYSVTRDFYALLPFYAKWNYQLRHLNKNFVAYCLLLKNAMSLGLYYYAKNLWELSQVSIAQMTEEELTPYLFIKDAIEQQYLLFQNQSHLLLDQLPSNANARLEMAQIYLLQGQIEEAKELLIQLFPFKRELKFWGRTRFLFALYLHQNQEFEEANLLLDELLSSALFDDFQLALPAILQALGLPSAQIELFINGTHLTQSYQSLQNTLISILSELVRQPHQTELVFREIKKELSFKLQILQLQFKNNLAGLQHQKRINLSLKYRMLICFAELAFTQYDFKEKEGFAYSLNHFGDFLLFENQWELAIQFKEYSKNIFMALTPYFHHKNDEVIWEIESGICEILLQVYRYDEVKKRLNLFTKENPLFSISHTTQSLTPQMNSLSAKIYYLLGLCEFHLKEYPQATQLLSQACQIFKSIPNHESYPKTLSILAHTLIETTHIFKKTNQSNMLDKISHLLDGAKSYAMLVQKYEKNQSYLFLNRILIQIRVLGLKNDFQNMEDVYFKINEFKQLIKKHLLQYDKKNISDKLYLTLIELELYYLMEKQSDEINQIKLNIKEDKDFNQCQQRVKLCLKEIQQSFKALRIDQDKFSFWEINMLKKRIQALHIQELSSPN